MTERGREGERESNKRDGGKKRKKGIERGMKKKEEEGRVTAAVYTYIHNTDTPACSSTARLETVTTPPCSTVLCSVSASK